MNTINQKNNLPGLVLTFIILLATYAITRRYLIPIVWAGVVVIASWPLYQHWVTLLKTRTTWAALSFTFFILLIILVPLTWIIVILIGEAQNASAYLILHNSSGISAPIWLSHLPIIGNRLVNQWNLYLAQPKFIQHFATLFHQHYQTFGGYLKVISSKTLYHSVSFIFCMLTLFFFFRDGPSIATQINNIGNNILPKRWNHYFQNLPTAIRGVVNGTVLSGLGVGIVMSLCYALTNLPFPALFGLATAFFAMIPFGLAIILLIAVITLLIKSSYLAAITILVIGIIVNFISDHIIKPKMISSAIELPFLMILIGIIGGIETLGLIGLFLGPIIMVMFYKLFIEYA